MMSFLDHRIFQGDDVLGSLSCSQSVCFEFRFMLVFHQYIFSIPVRTIFDPHPEGCVAICMTMDAKYLAALSNSAPQVASSAFVLSSIHHQWESMMIIIVKH